MKTAKLNGITVPRNVRNAIVELYEIESGTGLATPDQIKSTAFKFGLEVWTLEGLYLEDAAMRGYPI